jgi:hypothetical protein
MYIELQALHTSMKTNADREIYTGRERKRENESGTEAGGSDTEDVCEIEMGGGDIYIYI